VSVYKRAGEIIRDARAQNRFQRVVRNTRAAQNTQAFRVLYPAAAKRLLAALPTAGFPQSMSDELFECIESYVTLHEIHAIEKRHDYVKPLVVVCTDGSATLVSFDPKWFAISSVDLLSSLPEPCSSTWEEGYRDQAK
jgi:hypothetical protein